MKRVSSNASRTDDSPVSISRLIRRARAGELQARKSLFAALYDELRQRAHMHREKWQGNTTLNTTALIHEAYLKMIEEAEMTWENRCHFLATASRAIRQILLNYARKVTTEKRGGHVFRFSLEELKMNGAEFVLTEENAQAFVDLDEAMQRLEKECDREARVIECRIFGGMSVKETAEILGVSERTVKRDMAMAVAWLRRELTFNQ